MQVLLDAAAADARLAGDACKAPIAVPLAVTAQANGTPARDAPVAPDTAAMDAGRAGVRGGKLDALAIEWDFTHHAYYPVLRLKNSSSAKR